MVTIHSIARIFFVLLAAASLTFSAPGMTPVQAQIVSAPANLSPADWAQIKGLMPATVIDAQQAYLKASNTEAEDEFGFSIAISGDTLVVGAPDEGSNATGVNGDQANNSALYSGAVYVFTRSGSDWSQQAYIKASNTEAVDHFGWSVAISGDTLIVGAPYEDSNATGINQDQNNNLALDSGAAYVFTRSGSDWSQQAYLKASNSEGWYTGNNADSFGWSVAISGDTLIVGTPYEDSNATGINQDENNNLASDSGAAYVFTRSGSDWSQQAYIKASNTEVVDYFGWSVAISGDKLIVGAPYEASNATGVNGDQTNNLAPYSGAAYVFIRSGIIWSQQAYVKASNTVEGDADHFGISVSIFGDTLVVGAPWESSNATGVNGDQSNNLVPASGAAYVFTRNGSDWSQQAYLKASNNDQESGDNFGQSVAISGDKLIVGAPYEASNATGINGDQTNNLAPYSGAAYVFSRNGNIWSQQAYIKASNTEEYDYFAGSVAISGDAAVVGTYVEASNTTGVNGDQANNLALHAGAAYVLSVPQLAVLSSLRVDVSPTSGANVNFSVNLSEPATGIVDISDFALTTTGNITGAVVTGVNGGPTAYTVTVATGSGDGTIRLDVLDDDSIVNAGNIPLGGVGVGNGNFISGETYIIDRTGPTVSEVTRYDYSLTGQTSVDFIVRFSEPITGLDISDFSLTTTDVTDASITNVSDLLYDYYYYVTVDTGSGDGTIRLDVIDNDSIVDLAGNSLGGVGADNGNFTSGETYTIDKTAPMVLSIVRADPNPTHADTVDFIVTFSKPVSGGYEDDFYLITTTDVTDAFVIDVSGSGTTRTVTVNTGSENNTLRLNLVGYGSIQDYAGNLLGGPFEGGETYTVYKTITYVFFSTGAQDGWILESSVNSKKGGKLNAKAITFNLGDDAAKRQYLGLLSFNTGAVLPDNAVITSVMLNVKKQGISGGGNPLATFQGFMVDIKNGPFGTAALKTGDFQTKASKSYGPFKPVPVSNWYSINLTGANGYVNKSSSGSSLTQIRLRFKRDDNNNAVANILRLFSGNAPVATDRPQLVITYYVP